MMATRAPPSRSSSPKARPRERAGSPIVSEVGRGHHAVLGGGELVLRGGGPVRDLVVRARQRAVQGDVVHRGHGRRRPGSARHPRLELAVEPADAWRAPRSSSRGRDRRTVSTPPSKPGSTRITWRKLWRSSPAPVSRTIMKATCAATLSPRTRPRSGGAGAAPALPLQVLVRVDPRRPQRRHEAEGESGEDRRPQREEEHGQADRGSPSPAAWPRGSGPRARAPPSRRGATPSAAPPSARSALSIRSWRASWAWLAPRAWRIAISRRRSVARTSIRLARLAQAISRRRATAPRSTQSAWLKLRVSSSW